MPLAIFAFITILPLKAEGIWTLIHARINIAVASTLQAQTPMQENRTSASKTNRPLKSIVASSSVVSQKFGDPTLFTQNDIKDLQKLANRRQHIEALFDELIMRERLLGAAEKRIDKKILEMKRLIVALQKSIKAK